MIWQDSKIKKLISDNQTFTAVPDELLNKVFFIWDTDLDRNKNKDLDWSRFIQGQRTIHTNWNKESFNGRVLLNTLEYGNSISSFDAMFAENKIISILVKSEPKIGNRFVTVGNDRTFFFAKYFPTTTEIDGEEYTGKIELISIKFYIENIANDGIVGLPYNIKIGNFNETLTVPTVEWDAVNQCDKIVEAEQVNLYPTEIEVFIPEAAGIIGIDLINRTLRKKTFKTFKTYGLKHYPSNNKYTVAPTQFKTFSVDNYGISNQADMTNSIKALMFTQTLSQVINSTATTTAGAGTAGLMSAATKALLGGTASMISGTSSLGASFFSDRSVLATQSAIATKQLDNDNSFLKLFLEADMIGSNNVTSKGNLDLTRQDTYEINRSKGSAESTATTLLPEGIDPKTVIGGLFKAVNNRVIPKQYNVLGVKDFDNTSNTNQYNKKTSIPFLLTPYGNNTNLLTTDAKLKEFLEFGVPRIPKNGDLIGKMYNIDNWQTYFRSNLFRPDAYSWWNWPVMYPSAVVGIYNFTNKGNSVTYDSGASGNAKSNENHWTTGLTIDKLSNNNITDKRDAYTSFKIEFDGLITELQAQIITSSQIKVMVSDGYNTDEYVFNSTGANTGSAADINQILEF